MFLHDDIYFTKSFENYSPKSLIPTGDVAAYQTFLKYRWVYNKLELYQKLGYEAFPHGITPNNFPIFSKPIYNLFGMSIGAKVVWFSHEWEYTAGHLWMPVFYGRHTSTDYALLDGEVVWSYSMSGQKDKNGSFTHWYFSKGLHQNEIKWIQEHLNDFTGIVNVESIGAKIIEVHLRCSTQFVDFYGDDFIPSMIKLYDEKAWNKSSENIPGYSFVVRVAKDQCSPDKTLHLNFDSTDEVKVHYTIAENKPLSSFADNDLNTYRIAIVNGENEVLCRKTAQAIEADIKKQLGI